MVSDILRRTTEDSVNRRSVAEWETYLSEVYYGHSVRPIGTDFVAGVLEKKAFAEIGISRHSATSHSICRTTRLIQADKIEQHAFVFPISGNFNCRQGGREISVAPGAVYILNASEPFEVDTYNGAASVAITLSSDICRMAIRGIDDKCCRLSIAETSLVSAVSAFVNGIMDSNTDADDLWLKDICCYLLDEMINPRHATATHRSWTTSDAARRLVLADVRRLIRERLHEPDFGITEVASAVQLSPRHVQNILKGVDSTFSQELLSARLHRAANFLRSSSRGTKHVGQIARECGFRSHAHFSTRYKERFGIVPKDETPVKR